MKRNYSTFRINVVWTSSDKADQIMLVPSLRPVPVRPGLTLGAQQWQERVDRVVTDSTQRSVFKHRKSK